MLKILLTLLLSVLLCASSAFAQLPGSKVLPGVELPPLPEGWESYDDKYVDPGTEIGQDFSMEGELFIDPHYSDHPWRESGNPASKAVFQGDGYASVGPFIPFLPSFQRFQRCFEPRMVLPICPFFCWPLTLRVKPKICPTELNTGFLFSYWWPENVVEINDFGISAINPAEFGRGDLMAPAASQAVFNMMKEVLPERLNEKVGIDVDATNEVLDLVPVDTTGRTKFAGILPGDQTVRMEGHVWKSFVHDRTSRQRKPKKGKLSWRYKRVLKKCIPVFFWYNGYKKGNKNCFYSTVPEHNGKIINLYTEQPDVAQIWRFPELSLVIAGRFHASAAVKALPQSETGPMGLIADGMTYYGSYVRERACTSYRLAKWPGDAAVVPSEIRERIDVLPNEWAGGEKICYRGGGQLFPLTGTQMGAFSPLPAAAYFARRALYLAERMGGNTINYFSDEADKLQRVSPQPPSECFKMNEVSDQNTRLFPRNLVHPDHQGSIRYMYWNMRLACTCQYRGSYPLPYLPGFLHPAPIGEGCHAYAHTDASRGDVEGQGEIKALIGGAAFPWPFYWPLLPYAEAAQQTYCNWGPPGFSTKICNVTNVSPGNITNAVSNISSGIQNIGQSIQNFGQNVTNGIQNIGNQISNLPDTIGNQVSNFGDQVTGAVDNVTNAVSDLPGTVTDQVTGAVDNVTNAVTDLPGTVTDQVTNQVTGVVDNVTNLPGTVTDQVTGAVDGVTQGAQNATEAVQSIGKSERNEETTGNLFE